MIHRRRPSSPAAAGRAVVAPGLRAGRDLTAAVRVTPVFDHGEAAVGGPLPARLREIFEGVQELIAKHRPDALSVEDVFYARNVLPSDGRPVLLITVAAPSEPGTAPRAA